MRWVRILLKSCLTQTRHRKPRLCPISKPENLESRVVLTPASFEAARAFPLGNEPLSGLVSGDFNQDGKPDLVTANYMGHSAFPITFLAGAGDGTFGFPVNHGSALNPSLGKNIMSSGDFDKDSKLDLVVADVTTTQFSVGFLKGNGDGTFAAPTFLSGGQGVSGLRVVDINQDGNLDVITAGATNFLDTTGYVRILRGNGDGTFQAPETKNLDLFPEFVDIGDADGNSLVDIIVAAGPTHGDKVQTLLNQPVGVLTNSAVQTSSINIEGFSAGDFTGDGKADIAIGGSNPTDGNRVLSVVPGSALNGFRFPDEDRYSLPVHLVKDIVATRFDSDSDLDLVITANDGSSQTLLFSNQGNGKFTQSLLTINSGTNGFAVNDFNQDGVPDLAASTSRFSNAGYVSVVLGAVAGGFSGGVVAAATGNAGVTEIVDINNDGKVDLLGPLLSQFALRLGNGDRTFQAPLFESADSPSTVQAADMNKDGFEDVILINPLALATDIYFGTGTGGFSSAASVPMDRPSLLQTIDVNHDGLNDFVFSIRSALEGAEIGVILNLGNKTFGNVTTYQVVANSLKPLRSPSQIVAQDLNGDTHLDLAISYIGPSAIPGGVGVLIGKGDGTFTDGGNYLHDTTPNGFVRRVWNLATGDFDGDGDFDLVVDDFTLLFNNGDATFQVATQADSGVSSTLFGLSGATFQGAQGLTAADVDRDGVTDILGAIGGDVILHLRGRGNGTFDPPQAYTTGGLSNPLFEDLNGDGIRELLTNVTLSSPPSEVSEAFQVRPLVVRNLAQPRPRATFVASDITESLPGTATFSVTYFSAAGIDLTTLNTGDVIVTGPGFQQSAALVSVDSNPSATQKTVVYQVTAPVATGWKSANNGRYEVKITTDGVRDLAGTAVPDVVLGSFQVRITSSDPSATISASNITSAGQPSYQFSAIYVDNLAIDASSIQSGDIAVKGPGGFERSATLVSITPSTNGTPVTTVYKIDAPRTSGWNSSDNGTYQIVLLANRVKDTEGNFVPEGTLGSITVNISAGTDTNPSAFLTASPLSTAGNSSYEFTVTYQDATGIDVSTLSDGDLKITGPNDFSQTAKFVGVDTNSNGSPRAATYRIQAPGAAGWQATHNGSYLVEMLANSVNNLGGASVPANSLGSFAVSINGSGNGQSLKVILSSGQASVSAKKSTQVDFSASIQGNPSGASPVKLKVNLLSGGKSGDVLSVLKQGKKPGQINVAKDGLRLGKTRIGTVRGGTGRLPLEITFNAGVSLDVMQQVLRRISFRSAPKSPGLRQIQFQFLDDAGNGLETASRTINVQ